MDPESDVDDDSKPSTNWEAYLSKVGWEANLQARQSQFGLKFMKRSVGLPEDEAEPILRDIRRVQDNLTAIADANPLRLLQLTPQSAQHFLDLSDDTWTHIVEDIYVFDAVSKVRPGQPTPSSVKLKLKRNELGYRSLKEDVFGYSQFSQGVMKTLSSLCAVNKPFHRRFTPFLYSSVWLRDGPAFKSFRSALATTSLPASFRPVHTLIIEFGLQWANEVCSHALRDLFTHISPTVRRFHFGMPLSPLPCLCEPLAREEPNASEHHGHDSYLLLGHLDDGSPIFPRLEHFYIRTHRSMARSVWQKWTRLRSLRLEYPSIDHPFVDAVMNLSSLTDLSLFEPLTDAPGSLTAFRALLSNSHPSLVHLVIDAILGFFGTDRYQRHWFDRHGDDAGQSVAELALADQVSELEQQASPSSTDSHLPHSGWKYASDRPGNPCHWTIITGEPLSESDPIPNTNDDNELPQAWKRDDDSDSTYSYTSYPDTDTTGSTRTSNTSSKADLTASDTDDLNAKMVHLHEAIVTTSLRAGLCVLFRPFDNYGWYDDRDEMSEPVAPACDRELEERLLRFALDWEDIEKNGPPPPSVLYRDNHRVDGPKRWGPHPRGGGW